MTGTKTDEASDGTATVLLALSPDPVTKLAALIMMSPTEGRAGWIPALATVGVVAVGSAVGLLAPHLL